MQNSIKKLNIFAFVLVFAALGLFAASASAQTGCGTFWNGSELVPIECNGSSNGNNNGNNDNDNDDDDNDNNGDEVSTLSATDVDENSARLEGEVTNGSNVDVWFVIDNNDSTPSCSDDDLEVSVSGDYDDGDEFSRTVSGLDEDETYYFRACTNDDSGSVRSFTTDDDNSNNSNDNDDDNDNDNYDDREVVAYTSVATNVTTNSATLNGLSVINEGGSGNAWFEYGLTTGLGERTPNQSVGTGSNNVSRQILNLSPKTSYYFRMVVQNSEGINRGDIVAFTTGGFSTATNTGGTPKPTGTTTTSVTSTSAVFLGLDITSNLDTVSVGDSITYTVSYKNVSGKDLKNVVMQVRLPYEVAFQKSTIGAYSKTTHTVTVTVETLPKEAKGEFIVVGEVLKSARGSSIIIASLLGIHDHPTLADAKVDSLSYSIVEVNKGNVTQSANSVFAGTFFPTSFIGWLLIVLIIFIIILIARKIAKDKEERAEQKKAEEGIKIAR